MFLFFCNLFNYFSSSSFYLSSFRPWKDPTSSQPAWFATSTAARWRCWARPFPTAPSCWFVPARCGRGRWTSRIRRRAAAAPPSSPDHVTCSPSTCPARAALPAKKMSLWRHKNLLLIELLGMLAKICFLKRSKTNLGKLKWKFKKIPKLKLVVK